MARAMMWFPPDFLWGTATAAHQVEGENDNNDWWAWEQLDGRILDGRRSGRACDWWTNAERDLDHAADMGTNAHRLSVEWSRIEPEPSIFDRAALDRYREILLAMRARGIEPMVTLHHFSNPRWLVEKGDFESRLVVDYFARYTERVVETLGDLVPKWITVNEPMVYLVMRYITGAFPAPRNKGWGPMVRALQNMLRCHAVAYHTIKRHQPEAQVGVAKMHIVFAPRPPGRRVDRLWAGWMDRLFNSHFLDALADGRLRQPFGRGVIPKLAGAFDFMGVNYYTRLFTHFPPRPSRLYDLDWGPEAQVSDGNFGEVYPAGLYQAIKAAIPYGKPIYITENGLPDEADRYRPAFLISHLREVWRAISFNYPVMGYYHWTLTDNFEWDRGWTQRFGLLALDPETQERTWRPSGRLYAEICHARAISSDMAARYAPELLPVLFPG